MLILGSMCSLLVQWRALHDALIVGFPVVTLAVMAWLVWRYWPRSHKSESAGAAARRTSGADSGLPPVMAAIALLLLSPWFERCTPLPASELAQLLNSGLGTSIVSASYTGTVNDRVALLNATLQFASATPGQTVPLFGGDVAVQQFTVKGGGAELIRDGDGVAAQLNSRGTVTLQVKLLVKIAGDVTKRPARVRHSARVVQPGRVRAG